MVEPMHDIDRYINEVISGINEANRRHGTNIQLEEIEIVPDEYPTEGQVAYCAMQIAELYIREAEQGAQPDAFGAG